MALAPGGVGFVIVTRKNHETGVVNCSRTEDQLSNFLTWWPGAHAELLRVSAYSCVNHITSVSSKKAYFPRSVEICLSVCVTWSISSETRCRRRLSHPQPGARAGSPGLVHPVVSWLPLVPALSPTLGPVYGFRVFQGTTVSSLLITPREKPEGPLKLQAWSIVQSSFLVPCVATSRYSGLSLCSHTWHTSCTTLDSVVSPFLMGDL